MNKKSIYLQHIYEKMKKIYLLLSLLIIFFIPISAQTTLLMGAQSTITNCGFRIFDDGGLNNNYAANVNEILTIYSNDPSHGAVLIEIQSLDIDTTDTLIIYDGTTTTGTVLTKINNNNYNPLGIFAFSATVQNSTGALTVQFKSDNAAQSAGFVLSVSCIAPCQRIEVHLDTVLSSQIPHIDPDDGYEYLDVCPYDTVHLVAYCTYPDNNFSYNQNDATTIFKWDFDLQEIDSAGYHSIDYYFIPGRGYDVAISAEDTSHCISLMPITFRVRTSQNPIRDVAHFDPICSGQTLNLNVGYDNLSSLQLDTVGSEQITSLGVTDTVFLPDGMSCPPYGYYYRSYVTFTSFAPTATIQSANDILNVRVKIEQSGIPDLRISLVCPNNSRCIMLPDYQTYGWPNGTLLYDLHFGAAYKPDVLSCNAAQNPMGTGWNYVWSNNTTQGYQYSSSPNGYVYQTANVISFYNPNWFGGGTCTSVDSSNVAAHSQFYHPWQNFSNMIGCPLNGTWYIEVQDTWTDDNGYFFEWEMSLDPHLLPQNWSYNVNVDTTYITGPGADGMYLVPDTSGNISYIATVIDEFGCQYDTIIPITVVPSPHPDLGEDIFLCQNDTITLHANYNEPNTTYLWNTGDHSADIFVISGGQYYLNVATSNDSATLTCYGSDTVNVGIYDSPNANFTVSDTSGCAPLSIRLFDHSTPEEANFNYEWMILHEDGTLAYSSHLKNPIFNIEEPGTYTIYLHIITENGCADSLFKWNNLHVHLQPIAEFEATPEISLYDDYNGTIHFTNYADSSLLSSTENSLSWNFGDGNLDSTTFSPTHTYDSWGDYDVTLSITSQYGCSSEITHTIVIEDNLVFPNVITPNNDNYNDVFAIGNLNTDINPEDPDEFRTNELFIYDRWGRKVYYAKNYDTYSRDGKIHLGNQHFDATGLSDGVYYYSFYYKGKVKVMDYHGSLSVIR